MLANPLRRLIHKPEVILSPFIREGMRVLEIGPGMGFFTIPMACMAGPGGKIVSVDVQERMLSSLKKRAAKRGLSERIETRLGDGMSLPVKDLEGSIDFALLFAVVHEVPDVPALFREVYGTLKSGGKMLFSEPSGHVGKSAFSRNVEAATKAGFRITGFPDIRGGHSVLMQK